MKGRSVEDKFILAYADIAALLDTGFIVDVPLLDFPRVAYSVLYKLRNP